MNRQCFFPRVIAIVSIFCLLAGCAAGPNHRSSATASSFATGREMVLPIASTFLSPYLSKIWVHFPELEQAVEKAEGVDGTLRCTLEGEPERLLLWNEDENGDRDYYVLIPMGTEASGQTIYGFSAASITVRSRDEADKKECGQLFPLHLVSQNVFLGGLLVEGMSISLSPVTLEDGTVVTDLYPLFVEFYERSGLYEVTEEGEGVFTAKFTYQTDSTQSALRFIFRADDSGRSVTVNFA